MTSSVEWFRYDFLFRSNRQILTEDRNSSTRNLCKKKLDFIFPLISCLIFSDTKYIYVRSFVNFTQAYKVIPSHDEYKLGIHWCTSPSGVTVWSYNALLTVSVAKLECFQYRSFNIVHE